MRKTKSVDPVVQGVINQFQTVYDMTTSFIRDRDSALKGLLISGDAGTGKTHWVKQAFVDQKAVHNVEYIKGGSISAAALYIKLWQNRAGHRIIVMDDCDLIHRPSNERRDMLDMIKGATEPTAGSRTISWERAQRNPLMVELDVPKSFDFQGRIIWITNDTMKEIQKAAKQHYQALISRFNIIRCYFNDQEKLLYTLHLIQTEDMLGKKCTAFKGGYPKCVQVDAIDYISKNYRTLTEITPRVAIKLADLRQHQPKNWYQLADSQIGNWSQNNG